MKPKRTLSAYVLLVGILGLSIVGGVLIYQIFSAATKTQVTTEQATLIKALDGQIDEKIMTNLKKRRVFTENQLMTQSYIPTPTQEASLGGNINVTPSIGTISSEMVVY